MKHRYPISRKSRVQDPQVPPGMLVQPLILLCYSLSKMKRILIGLFTISLFSQPPVTVKIPLWNPSTQQTAYASFGQGIQLINGVLTFTAPAAFNYADGETPAGALDGNNAVFTLAHTPNPAASLALYRNGQLDKAGVDFTLNGPTVTFLAGAIPQPGDLLVAQQYRY